MRTGAYCPTRERSDRRRVERTPSTMMMPIVVTQLLWTTEAVGRRRSTAEGSNPNPPTTATLPCVLNKPTKCCEPRYAAPTRLRACLPSQPRRACVTAVFADACSDTFRPMFHIYLKSTVGSIRVPIVSCTHGCAHAHTHAHHAPHCIQGCRSAGGRGRGAERSRRRRGSAASGGAFES